MRAIFGANAGICLAIGLLGAGCSTVPELSTNATHIAIRDVVSDVECELYHAVHDFDAHKDPRGEDFGWIRNYTAKVELVFQVLAEGAVTPSLTTGGSLPPGTFSVGIGGGLTGTADRIATYAFLIPFEKIDDFARRFANIASTRMS